MSMTTGWEHFYRAGKEIGRRSATFVGKSVGSVAKHTSMQSQAILGDVITYGVKAVASNTDPKTAASLGAAGAAFLPMIGPIVHDFAYTASYMADMERLGKEMAGADPSKENVAYVQKRSVEIGLKAAQRRGILFAETAIGLASIIFPPLMLISGIATDALAAEAYKPG
jgi:hypothetical protein